MNYHQWCLSVQIFIVLCGRLTYAATESATGFASTINVSPTNGEPLSSATPPPGGTEAVDPASVGTTEAVTLDSTAAVTLTVSEAPTMVTEEPPATTTQPVVTSEGNLHLPPVIFHELKISSFLLKYTVPTQHFGYFQ